jgi:Leucine-rich repeat (LRR) protein
MIEVARLTRLTSLDLGGINKVSNVGIAHISRLSNLLRLSFNQTLVTDGIFNIVASQHPKLMHLNLSSAHLQSSLGYHDMIRLTALERLNLNNSEFSDEHLTVLAHLTKLTHVSLMNTRVTLPTFILALVAMPSAVSDLAGVSFSSDSNETVEVPDSLRLLTGLKKLALEFVTFPQALPLATTPSSPASNPLIHLTSLVNLILDGRIGDEIVPVLGGLVNLKNLMLGSMTQVSIEAAKTLIASLPTLRNLTVTMRDYEDAPTLTQYAREKYPELKLTARTNSLQRPEDY